MKIPGFGAAASVYRTLNHYQTIATLSGNSESVTLTGEIRIIPGLGIGTGCRCPPHQGPCSSDPGCNTGCSGCSTYFVNCDCGVTTFPCWGCSGGCPTGLIKCNGICTDLSSDSENCGSCFHGCPAGFHCSNSLCCPPGSVSCGGTCCAPGTTGCNGTCCAPGSPCCGGVCGSVCPDGSCCQSATCSSVCPDGIHCCSSGTCHPTPFGNVCI